MCNELIGIVRSIKFLFGVLFILLALNTSSQVPLNKDSIFVSAHPVKIKVRHIIIEGNNRTKSFVILRQLIFKEGDSLLLSFLPKIFEESKENVINLSLFTKVDIQLQNWAGFEADVDITVTERWYTFPQVAFDIYDRNFNQWWVTHNHDLNRVQYGGRFLQQNIRGRGEDFNIGALFGYAQRFDIGYKFPFIDNRLTKGLKLSAYMSRQRDIAYESSYNKELFILDPDRFLRTAYGGQVDFTFKPKIYFTQTITLGYNRATINDTISRLNPFYFKNGNEEHYLFITLSAINDKRNWRYYAFKGSYTEFTINQVGVGLLSNINITNLYFLYQKYVQLSDKFFFASLFNFKYSFPVFQPYYNQKGLGYKDAYVSGYEYYVVDGQAYALGRFQLRYKLISTHLPILYLLKKSKATVPFYIIPKIYFDTGYVLDNTNRPDNPLANTVLAGYGAGIDIATAYDITFRFEYSFNRKGENGLYLHFSSLF